MQLSLVLFRQGELIPGRHNLEILHNIRTKYRSPDSIRARNFGPMLARRLEEPRYWDSQDSLNLVDLRPEARPAPVDSLRRFLQRFCPENMLDEAGRDERALTSKSEDDLTHK